MNNPLNNTPDKALVEQLLADACVAFGHPRTMSDDLLIQRNIVHHAISAALSQPQYGGLVEGMQRAAGIARDFAEQTNEDGVLLHKRECISAANEISHRIIAALASNSPVVGEDAPVAWVSPGQFEALKDPEAGEGGGAYLPVRKSSAGNFTMPLYAKPTPTDTADRREAVEFLRSLEWVEDDYTLRMPCDGDIDSKGKHILIGGETVITFADSDEGSAAWEAIASLIAGPPEGVDHDALRSKIKDAINAHTGECVRTGFVRHPGPTADAVLALIAAGTGEK